MLKTIKKAQQGFTIIELLIVIAIIGILAGLVLNNFQGAQAKARDVQRRADVNAIHGKLEEYYNTNNGYPDGNLSTTLLAGIDAEALKDTQGNAIAYTGGFITSATAPNPAVSNTSQYVYAAYGCTTAGAQTTVGATCTKYILKTYLEKETGNQFTKNSLN
ncbi:type II secretion system protein [bacterium]|nr:type II secretion system protein [bacterium]NBX97670.1 type II secretion system protein [bacterium]NDC94143.1 type II secretion system protein [bacterium]NDD83140.1 type II secretion system protein [bacterium]NDG29363.1 type II secretion system protein [bacterium]